MIFVIASAVALVACVSAMVREVRRRVPLRRVRRGGVQSTAEIVDVSTRGSSKPGAYYMTPIVRYHLGGKVYEAEVVNAQMDRPQVGSSMTVVVSPEFPWTPMDPYGGLGATLRGAIVGAVLSVGMLALAIALY
jgi:hypothetical protein